MRFLEAQTHKRDQRHVNHHLVRALKLQPGQRWLEVGSGSGALCRMTALLTVGAAGSYLPVFAAPDLSESGLKR